MYPEVSFMLTNRLPAYLRCLSLALVFLVVSLLIGSAAGQTVSQPTEPPKLVPGMGTAVQDQATPPPSPQTQPAPAPEQQKPITKAQAKELFRSVDEILQFVSQIGRAHV